MAEKYKRYFIIQWCESCLEGADDAFSVFLDEMEFLINASACRMCKAFEQKYTDAELQRMLREQEEENVENLR